MFITKKNRIVVYSYLFKEGTIVVKKDYYLDKHSEEVNIPNVEVMALLKSFASKGLVKVSISCLYVNQFIKQIYFVSDVFTCSSPLVSLSKIISCI